VLATFSIAVVESKVLIVGSGENASHLGIHIVVYVCTYRAKYLQDVYAYVRYVLEALRHVASLWVADAF
jgi:hypothetical protein